MIGLDSLISRQLRVRARPDFDLVAVGKIDGGIEDHLVAVLDAGTRMNVIAEEQTCLVVYPAVCTENLIRIEPVRESPQAGGDDRADPPGLEPVGRTLQVEEPA